VFARKKEPLAPKPAVDARTLRGLVPIGQLSPEAFAELARRVAVRRVPAGTRLFAAGEVDDRTLYLIDGEVELVADGGIRERVTSKAGSAEMPLSPGRPRRLSARTRTESVVAYVPSSLLDVLLRPPRSEDYQVTELADDDPSAENRLLCAVFADYMADRIEIPSLPDIALRVRVAVEDPNSTINGIAAIVTADPGIAAKLVSIANSPAYAPPVPIDNCPDAIRRLGLVTTREIVTSLALRQLFRARSARLRSRMRALWLHSTTVAAISTLLARRTPGISPDRALLAGLLHDVGALIVIARAESYPELAAGERALDTAIGKLRGQLGAMALRRWGFDDEVVETAVEAEEWRRDKRPQADLADVVLVAQLLSLVGTGQLKAYPPLGELPARRKLALGELGPAECLAVIEGAKGNIEALKRSLGG